MVFHLRARSADCRVYACLQMVLYISASAFVPLLTLWCTILHCVSMQVGQ